MSMTPQDREAIESVFNRLKQVESQGAPRDPEAEQYIQERLQAQPGAAYYLAQTVVVQEQALKKAQEQLQTQSAPKREAADPLSSSGFGRKPVPGIGTRLGAAASQDAPQPARGMAPGGMAAGGGFLAGALQTAMGVAGGLMLGNMLAGLFTGNDAHAAEVPPEGAAAQDPGADAGHEHASDAGYEDAGYDDGGGFDGGDFGDI